MRVPVFLLAAVIGAGCMQLSGQGVEYDLMIQGAVDWELQPLLAALEHKKERQIEAWTYWTGNIGRLSVVLARTGVGPINATASTLVGIENFHPKAVINQGTAGGHDPNLQLYDIVLGEKTVDFGAYQSEHGDAGSGTKPDRWHPAFHKLNGVVYRAFVGDPELMAEALQVRNERGRVVKGTVGSAFQYNRELDRIAWLRRTYGTDSEDMESAFAAGIATAMHVPFLAIRILSDSEWNHPQLERKAGDYCAEFSVKLARRMEERTRIDEKGVIKRN